MDFVVVSFFGWCELEVYLDSGVGFVLCFVRCLFLLKRLEAWCLDDE